MLTVANLLITTRRVGALAFVTATAPVVGRGRAMPVAAAAAAVVVLALAVPAAAPAATAAVVIITVSVSTPVVTIITSAADGRLAHVYAWRGSVCALCDGEIHTDSTSVYLHSGALVFGHFRILLIPEVDEAETAGTTSLSIDNNLNFVNWSILRKDVIDLLFSGV